MKHRRVLELFFLKAKDEFNKRKVGEDGKSVVISYFGCDFTGDKMVLNGQRVIYGSSNPMILPENHNWEEGVQVFEAIMKDLTE